MRLFEFTKSNGYLLILFAIAVQLGCDASSTSGNKVSNFEVSALTMAEPPMAAASGYEFEAPVRLMAGGEYVSVESPGYACPTMADVDEDGKLDLVVGQFNNGKMLFCKNIAEAVAVPEFAKADWIKTESDPAQVPGVW